MIMNEFDDERTIDEEEELGQEDQQKEINDLEKEQDMPIEELMKLYGYAKPAEVEDNEQLEKDDLGDEDCKISEDTDDTEAKETIQESDVGGKKRSISTPPPNKKPRSELAKYVCFKNT